MRHKIEVTCKIGTECYGAIFQKSQNVPEGSSYPIFYY